MCRMRRGGELKPYRVLSCRQVEPARRPTGHWYILATREAGASTPYKR